MRKKHELTQEEVARHAQVAYKYYQEIENGRATGLRLTTLDRIAAVYGTETYALFRERMPKTKLTQTAIGPPHYHKRRVGGQKNGHP